MKTFTVLIFLAAIIAVFPQKKLQVGGGYDAAFPVGKLADIAGTGHNWSLFAEYPINKQWGLQFLTGYMIMPVEEFEVAVQGKIVSFDLKFIPIKGAVKYYLYDEFFFQGELGVTFAKLSQDLTNSYGETETESIDFQAKLTAGAGLGASFRLSDQSFVNVTGKYMYVDGGDLDLDFNHFLLGAGLVVLLDL